jgi:hypothetical protein
MSLIMQMGGTYDFLYTDRGGLIKGGKSNYRRSDYMLPVFNLSFSPPAAKK